MFEIQSLIYSVPAVLLALSAHEFAHGYVSYMLGDPTPKKNGRLSLNPLHHLDLVGTLSLLFFHFGWAKPVMVNPYYYKNKKQGMVNVALAGPLMNFILAFFSIFFFYLLIFFNLKGSIDLSMVVWNYLLKFFQIFAIMNIGLGTFNLLPIPPLDGSKFVGAVLPEEQYFKYMRFEKYGTILLLLLLYSGVLSPILSFVQNALIDGMSDVVMAILNFF